MRRWPFWWLLVVGLGVVIDTARAQQSVPTQAASDTPHAAEQDLSALEEHHEGAEPPLLISMEFEDAKLKDVLKMFSQQTGLDLIASEEIGDKTITLYLEDVTVPDALDQILDSAGLMYERQPGSQIAVVKPRPPSEAPTVITETRVYRLKFARVSTSRLARAAEGLGSLGSAALTSAAGSGGTSLGTGGGLSAGASGGRGGVGIDKVIGELLTEHGNVVVDERTNKLIVTDVPRNFPRIEAAILALDIKTPQVLIEVELLEIGLAKLKDLGVEWGSGSEGDFFQLTPAKMGTRFPYSVWSQWFRDPGRALTSDPTITAGTIDTSKAVAVLQALEKDTNTKILARPKILTLDNESAVIRLSSDQAIGFRSTTGEQTATTTATPERTTTGVVLSVTPQVNEGGFVTLLVEPSVTQVVSAKITPPTSVGGTVVDPKTRSARAMVRIRQGETLVLGGMIDRTESAVVQRVPGLSSIPILGEVFKNREADNSASELVVFVTPRILEEAVGPQVASAAPAAAPSLDREQPAVRSRQDVMEETLTRLERSQL